MMHIYGVGKCTFTFASPFPLAVQLMKLEWLSAGRWSNIPSRVGVEILLVVSCYRNQDRLWPDGPLGSYTDLTLPFSKQSILYYLALINRAGGL